MTAVGSAPTCLDILRAGMKEVGELLDASPDAHRGARLEWMKELNRLAMRESYVMDLDRKGF